MAEIWRGSEIRDALRKEIGEKVDLMADDGIVPKLVTVRVGNDPADCAYERGISKAAEAVGVLHERRLLDEGVKTEELIETVTDVVKDQEVDGILVFRPLPEGISEAEVLKHIPVEKDVDCATDESLSQVMLGRKEGFPPCTAEAVVELIVRKMGDERGELAGKDVTIVGRSEVVGKPLAMMLMALNATVTVCHSRTRSLEEKTKNADVVVAAMGRKHFLGRKFFSDNQVVIDVGINPTEDGITGDVDFEEVKDVVKAITPVPGGVGGITNTVLMNHVVAAAGRRIRS